MQPEAHKVFLPLTCKSTKFQLLNPAKDRVEFPQLKHTAHQTQCRGRAGCEAKLRGTNPLRHAALHNKLSCHADQQLLRTAASASGLDASQ